MQTKIGTRNSVRPSAMEVEERAFLNGGGETGRLIGERDWTAALGTIETWPQSLKTATSMLLRSPVPIVMLWGEDGIMIYNDAYSGFAGSRHPNLLGSKVREGWPEVADFNDNVMRVCQAGETLRYKDQELTLYRHGRAEQVWMDLDYSPVLDESGQPAGVIAIVVETTERVAAERATAQSEARLRAYLTASSDVLYRMNPDWSQMFELDGRGFIRDLEQPTRDWIETYILADDHERVRTAIAHATKTKSDFELEHRVRRVDGSLGWTYSHAVPLFGADGEIAEWFGAATDITERRRQEALEVARNRVLELTIRDTPLSEPLNALVRTVEDYSRADIAASILVVDEDGRRLRHGAAPSLPDAYNEAVDGILIGEAMGSCGTAAHRKAAVFVSDIAVDPICADFRDLAAAHGLRACWSIPILAADRSVLGVFAIYHRQPCEPTRDDLKMVDFVVHSASLAIEHKRTNQALRLSTIDNARLLEEVTRSNSELERRVLERTAELEQAHEALRQSQKMEAVGQLTGGIAHDFNNMLAVVIGSLDLLGRRIGANDSRAKRYVDAAADGARRAAQLTQRLLAFSRQQPLRPEAIDPNKLVAGMSDLLRHSLGADVLLETVLAGGVWRIHADLNQLENVILNLAVNARDAMPDGGRLTIETQNAHLDDRYAATHLGLAPGQYVLVAVSDTGGGMPQEVVAKAFDPFFTTKEVGKGTGLGLSQVYGFVKQSGGHVKIYSEVNQGTTVKVYLPRFMGSSSEGLDPSSNVDLPLGEQQEVVLVVEDEPAVRQFSVDALTELGYRVLEADGAASAMRLILSHPEIALLFTDVVMPEINGAKLAQEVRRHRPDIKVLFTTGYTRNAVVHNGVLDRDVQMIGKPFTIEALAAKLREVLDTVG